MATDMKEQLLTKNLFHLMFQLSIPAVLGMLVIGLYPLMDGIFAGQIIGQTAMTACAVALPLTFFNSGVSTLLGVGSASILSRAIGKNDEDTIRSIMGNMLYWVILFSLIITISGIFFAPYFLDLVGADGDIKVFGIRYLRILFLGSLFVNFAQAANMLMRGEGLMKRAMSIMALGAIINIVLDPIFMIAMGDHAIEGAALATIMAQFIQAGVTFHYFKYRSKYVKITTIKKEKNLSKEMFSIGISAMIMQLLFIIQQSLLYKQAFHYGGESFGIIMAATMRIYAFSFIPLWGMSQGLQPVIGTNFGAKKYHRVAEGMKVFCIGALVLSAVFWIPIQIFPEMILGAFHIEPEMMAKGVFYFRMFFSVYILYGIMMMTITYFQAIGDGRKAGRIVMLRQLFLFVPTILFLPMIFGPLAVWWAEPLVDFLVIVGAIIMCLKSLRQLSMENRY